MAETDQIGPYQGYGPRKSDVPEGIGFAGSGGQAAGAISAILGGLQRGHMNRLASQYEDKRRQYALAESQYQTAVKEFDRVKENPNLVGQAEVAINDARQRRNKALDDIWKFGGAKPQQGGVAGFLRKLMTGPEPQAGFPMPFPSGDWGEATGQPFDYRRQSSTPAPSAPPPPTTAAIPPMASTAQPQQHQPGDELRTTEGRRVRYVGPGPGGKGMVVEDLDFRLPGNAGDWTQRYGTPAFNPNAPDPRRGGRPW